MDINDLNMRFSSEESNNDANALKSGDVLILTAQHNWTISDLCGYMPLDFAYYALAWVTDTQAISEGLTVKMWMD